MISARGPTELVMRVGGISREYQRMTCEDDVESGLIKKRIIFRHPFNQRAMDLENNDETVQNITIISRLILASELSVHSETNGISRMR